MRKKILLFGFIITGLVAFNLFFQIYTIKGDSMGNTLADGAKAIALKYQPLLYPTERIDHGDKVFFSYIHDNDEMLLVKTIVGVPGDTCEIVGTVEYKKYRVKNRDYSIEFFYDQASEQYFKHDRSWVSKRVEQKEIVVLKNKYLVLGDNVYSSLDSRALGPVDPSKIKAKLITALF